MTTPSTGDARAGSNLPDEVVEAVARAIFICPDDYGHERMPWDDWDARPDLIDIDPRDLFRAIARAAIEAYRKAMREAE